ncbi:MAG: lipoprotein-releasing ABC transporter permease subunit [Rhodospirillaceae bacterium]|nr:lipoprotein-releasing ABC transporter permease subunit [Rhodospirillaceae bacterium]
MIFGPFERMVAMRYLRARRKEGFVSVIAGFSLVGIALGVATLIIVMAVMNGFRADIMDRILGVNGHLNVYGAQESILDYEAKARQLKTIPGVLSVIPIVEGQVLVTSNTTAAGAIVRGTKHEDIMETKWISDHIVDGSLAPYITGEGILIGARMADRFNVKAGQEITLISPKGNVSAFGSVPRAHAFPVAGVFNMGMSEYDGGVIFMPLALAQTYFKYPASVTNMEVRIEDPLQARPTARQVEDVLGPKVRVFTWEQTNGPFFNALQVERNVMFLILTLIILVAAMNIISGLIMLVKDKGRDIAILRTMGATRGMIMRIFLLGGASVGVIGTVVGFVLGLLFCDNIEAIRQFLQRLTGTELFSPEIYFLTQIPAKMNWNETLAVVLMALVLSFVATLYPSWRAARTDPVEALRYE